MSRETWTYEELFEGLDPAPAFVAELERLGLLRVVARDADGRSLYGPEAREELAQVMGLVELGYQPRDIAAIARRVGLPARRRRLFQRAPRVLGLEALAERGGVALSLLAAWVDEGLVEPALVSEHGEPLFDPDAADRVRALGDLGTLGLEPEAVVAVGRTLARVGAWRALDEEDPRRAEAEGLAEDVEALLSSLEGPLDRLQQALRRWDKLAASLRRQLTRMQRASQGGRKRRGARRVRTRTRGRKGPGHGDA